MWENYRVSTVAYYEKARRSELRGEYFDEDQDFFNEKAKSRRITPGYIHRLLPNEIVVFGSNILGHHNGSLAEKAVNEWGAVNGRPNGRQGQCYAIATDGATLDSIRFQVQGFIEYARSNPHLLFLVTRIGCGNAGWHAGHTAPASMMREMSQSVCHKSFGTSANRRHQIWYGRRSIKRRLCSCRCQKYIRRRHYIHKMLPLWS